MQRPDFNAGYLQGLMPSAKKKKTVQILKRLKNKLIQMCEEAAKADHDHCVITLQRLELGLPLQYGMEELAEELADWAETKGLRVHIDPATPLCLQIEWGPIREEEKPVPLPTVPLPLLPPTQPQGSHPFFNWDWANQKTPAQPVRRK